MKNLTKTIGIGLVSLPLILGGCSHSHKTISLRYGEKATIIENLSEDYRIKYLAKDPRGTLYLINRPKSIEDFKKINKFYRSFEVFIGPADYMLEAKLTYICHIGNGALDIFFDLDGEKGKLYFPAGYEKEAKPLVTYEGQEPLELEWILR